MMNTMRTFFLLAALTVILVLVGDIVAPGGQGMMVALAVTGLMNFIVFLFADKIVLAMYRAQPLDESHWLHDAADRLARKAGIPKPRLYMVANPQPNAFATGRSPKKGVVAFTTGLVQNLNREEVEGVLAHEMAHIKNRDTLVMVVAATIAGAVMMLARMATYAAMFGGHGRGDNRGNPLGIVVIILIAILAPLAAMMVQMAISRAREFGADEGAKEIIGSPMPLVNALRKLDEMSRKIPMDTSPATAHLFIVNPFGGRKGGGGFASLFMTHPPIEKRIARLLGRE